jgi:hypothetical protein
MFIGMTNARIFFEGKEKKRKETCLFYLLIKRKTVGLENNFD